MTFEEDGWFCSFEQMRKAIEKFIYECYNTINKKWRYPYQGRDERPAFFN